MQSVDLARDAFALVDVHILAWVGPQRGPREDPERTQRGPREDPEDPIHGEEEGEGVHQDGGDVAGGGRRSHPPPRNQSDSRPPSNLLLCHPSRDLQWASRPQTPPSCSLSAGSGTKLSPGKKKVLEKWEKREDFGRNRETIALKRLT